MWQKVLAGILVILGAQGFGFAYSQGLQSLCYHYKQQERLLSYITGEISFLHRPIQEILWENRHRLQEPYGGFMERIAVKMEQNNGYSLLQLWEAEIVQLSRNRSYPVQALEMLQRIGISLGSEEDTMQLAAIHLLQQELEEAIQNIKEEKEEKGSLVQTLSLLAGIICVVLFL